MMVAEATACRADELASPRNLCVRPLHCPAFETTAAMQRSEERVLTTHVGSLIRPPELGVEHAKATTPDAAEACQREAVTEAVAHQSRIGLDIVNDGEYGKSSWANYIL